jgi:hypothetical protein
MSENNNPTRTLSDVALERVMRDVLGFWEPPPRNGNGHHSDAVCPPSELPDDDGESAY